MTKLIAVVVGAILAGAVQTIIAVCDRRREAETILTAIASEVDALCRLIRGQRYREEVRDLLIQVKRGALTEGKFIVDARLDYFAVYHSLSLKLGMLKPNQAADIVKFYSYCKSLIDSTRAGGIGTELRGRLDSVQWLQLLIEGLDEVLRLGDKIVRYPRLTLG